jgi:hypothetical protein
MKRQLVPAALVLLSAFAGVMRADGDPSDRVLATNQFEYSYSSETEREIVENWLDVSYHDGRFLTGLLLNSQQPSEEGFRQNRIRHRFFAFATGGFDVRVGHFYGLFGRGLLFAAYEDRTIRVDTVLDGIIATTRRGRWQGTFFSGSTPVLERDVRGLDLELDLGRAWSLGGSSLTYRPDDLVAADGSVHREWAVAGRLAKFLAFGDCYFEYGWKKGYDFDAVPDDRFRSGTAFYGSLNLFAGPVALSLEGKSYKRFAILRKTDGVAALNRPPALAREHLYALLNRAPHLLNPDDEEGGQAELTWNWPAGWNGLLNLSRTESQDGRLLFEEAYGQVEKERWGDFRLRGAFGYMDSEGLRQTVITEATYFLDPSHTLTLEAEHQHVRLGGGPGFDLGAYDQDFFKLEYATAPAWAFAGILEVNNKYDEQRDPREKSGPFPALQVSYASTQGAQFTLWAGKRQAGQLCSGGVCKFEPAFEGIELTGIFRY